MKIGYLCPDLGISPDGYKGASSHIRGFVSALRELGHSVDILSPNGGIKPIDPPSVVSVISQEKDPRLFRALRHLLYNGSIEASLKEYLYTKKPDLIYERYSPFSAAGGAVCQALGVPHFLEVNAPLAEQGKLYRKQALQEVSELMEEAAFAAAGTFVVLTDELKDWLVSKGISENRILMKPCAVDPNLFSSEGDRISFNNKIVIGFVGSLKPWHDVELVARTFERLQSDPRIHLLVVGDGPMRDVIKELATKYPGRVTMTGAIAQENIPPYLRAMDIALAPYPKLDLFYFSPLKVYEYMAAGRATVATGIGQISSLIEHEQTGLLVPPQDEDRLVAAVQRLLDNPSLRKQIGARAAKQILKQHTWAARAQNWIDDVAKIRK